MGKASWVRIRCRRALPSALMAVALCATAVASPGISANGVQYASIPAAVKGCATPCTVLIPEGRYVLTGDINPVYINAKIVHLVGAGRGKTILAGPPKLQAAVSFTGTSTGSSISHLTLQGPGDGSGIGINAGSAVNIQVEDVEITGWSIGINTGGNSSRWTIANNSIHGNSGDGIFLAPGTNDCEVRANQVYDNGSNGIDINGSRNRIADNQVLRNGQSAAFGEWDRSGIFVEAIGANADNNTVSGNTVEKNFGRGITVRSGAAGLSTRANSVINNKVRNNGIGIYLDTAGIRGSVIDGTQVTGNEVTGNRTDGIWLYDSGGATVSNTVVRGNTVTQSGKRPIRIDGSGVRNSVIEANVVR
ncbi:MAG: right-handed parallel beta-helix repeat-containing protein [Terriglobales bacterium]|jgi:parallel beta-helix repeat protein